MAPKKIKQPPQNRGANIQPHGSKTLSDEDRHPKFSLRLLQPSHCITKCQRNEKAALADKLYALSQLTWSQIRKAPRKGLGYEKIAPSAIRPEVPAEAKSENIIAFRFCGKAPMIGFKKAATFYILWLDRGYEVYDHG